jgi:gliding motility-associated-like protein
MKKAMAYTTAFVKARYGMGLLLLTLLGSTSLQAQSITPQTLNVTGGYAEVGGYSLGYSLGEESSISYYVNTLGFSISAGFLQDFSFANTISSVRNLQATVDNQTIEVSWEKPTENVKGLVGYNLEISEDSLNYVLVSKTKELSYKIENLTNSQKYWIKVNAYSLYSSGEEKVIGPLIPTSPAIEDVVVAGTQEFNQPVVVVNGIKVEPTIQTSENSVSLRVGDIVMDLGGSSESGGKLPLVDGVLLLEPKGKVELKGGGFKSNTSIAVWLIQNSAATTGGRLGEFNPYLQSRLIEKDNEYQYSSKVVGAKAGTAYFLGYSDVDANGNFTSNLVIPENLILGRFTLQARGIGKDGEPASINLGAIVAEDLTLDTDGDEVPDYIEVRENTDLKDPENYLDTDGDLVPDYIESRDGTDVNNPKAFKDTDLDGVPDYVQVRSIKSSTLEEVVLTWGLLNHLSKLPAKVDVEIYSGEKKSLDLVWNNTGTVNILKRGTYELTGTIALPKGYFNAYNIKGKVRVIVLPKPAPRDVAIDNSTFAGNTTVFFIPVGAFVVNDPVDNIHEVTFFGDGYDNKYFFIKDNILYWNSAERAPGRTSFSIVIRVTDRDGNTLDKFFTITRTRKDFSSLTISNSYTPNGDRFNDTWGVPEIRFYEGARISVYDRGGSRLFYTENPDIRWDGTYNGKEMPVGSYFWTIEIRETGEMRRGMLNLIRK